MDYYLYCTLSKRAMDSTVSSQIPKSLGARVDTYCTSFMHVQQMIHLYTTRLYTKRMKLSYIIVSALP